MAVKPFLRWAGSKQQALSTLQSYWSPHFVRYVEPFAGSAALFFALCPSRALLSDSNPHLIETFTNVRDAAEDIAAVLEAFPKGREAYYQLRSADYSALSSIERAARFIYLNRFCFNGLYRTNSAGQFNVPYSPSRTGSLPSLDQLQHAADALAQAKIQCVDFQVALKDVRAGDFIYLDPPYAVRNRRIFKQYGPDVFGTEDLARLSHSLRELDRKGAAFLVSYADCEEGSKFLSEWSSVRISVNRNIAGFAKHRGTETEVLYTNIPFSG